MRLRKNTLLTYLRIDVDGKKLVIRDIIGMETVVEGEILMIDLANAVVKIAVTAD